MEEILKIKKEAARIVLHSMRGLEKGFEDMLEGKNENRLGVEGEAYNRMMTMQAEALAKLLTPVEMLQD